VRKTIALSAAGTSLQSSQGATSCSSPRASSAVTPKPLEGDLDDYVRVNDKHTQCSSRTRRTAATTFGIGSPVSVGRHVPDEVLTTSNCLLS
jgi:hypothetical protein